MPDDTTGSIEPPPIACTLTGDDFRERLTWISELNRDGLKGYEQKELALELRYAPHVINRVRELVSKERRCCAFLRFDLREDQDQVMLTITAPEGARGAVPILFQQFVESA